MVRLIDYLASGVIDSSGAPLALGKVDFFNVSTGLRTPVFKDYNLTDPHPNPATLDAAGKLVAYSDAELSLVITPSSGSPSKIEGLGSPSQAIQAGDFADAAITTAKIADGAGTSDKIADNSISTSLIENSAVSSSAIADGAITNTKRADPVYGISAAGAITSSSNTWVDVTGASVTLTRTAGRPVLLFGQFSLTFNPVTLRVTRGDGTSVGSYSSSDSGSSCANGSAYRWIDLNSGSGAETYKLQVNPGGSNNVLTSVYLIGIEI